MNNLSCIKLWRWFSCFFHHFTMPGISNWIYLAFEKGPLVLNHLKSKIFLHLFHAFSFILQQPSLAVLHSPDTNTWQRVFWVSEWRGGEGRLYSPSPPSRSSGWIIHGARTQVFSETSLEHVWASEGPGNLQTVTVCRVKEQSINLQRNVKRTGFSCLWVGREPNVCCHLMVESVYTCSDQLST